MYRPSETHGTPTIADGILTGGNSQLTDPFANTGDWKLKMSIKLNGNDCGVGIRTALTMQRYYNWFKVNGDGYVGYSPTYSGSWYADGRLSVEQGNWQTLIIENTNGTLSISINDKTITHNNQWDGRNSSQFYIGLNQGSGDSEMGSIQNIRLLYL